MATLPAEIEILFRWDGAAEAPPEGFGLRQRPVAATRSGYLREALSRIRLQKPTPVIVADPRRSTNEDEGIEPHAARTCRRARAIARSLNERRTPLQHGDLASKLIDRIRLLHPTPLPRKRFEVSPRNLRRAGRP